LHQSPSSSRQSGDLADSNQDGTVSEMERLAYASKQLTATSSTFASTTSEAANTD
jgi:hypothetical protein